MQIPIGKRMGYKVGQTLYYQDSMGTKAYVVVQDLDAGTCRLRHATKWEIVKFKALMPLRRLRRWALENREEM
jgi:hypothetical protein